MPINYALTEIILEIGHNKEFTPYLMFKYAIKTEITREYYEKETKKFLISTISLSRITVFFSLS